ncbi:MAG: UDP-N-acetylmuramoyl-tripeptide--D-alanyl-D-alanine ligase [Oscillospiraceae bacterium]
MKNLTLNNIIKAVGGVYHGDAAILEKTISAVTTDSRKVTENCLFAAIKGENSDGHDYIEKAFEMGALCVIAEHLPENCENPIIVVKNTITALGDIAAFYRRQFDIPVIGITGSVGKTTAKEMLYAVLSSRFRVHRTPENLNNELGVPLTIFGLNETHEAAIIEMGISHFGEMHRLAEIVSPDMALYTVIGAAHLEFLGDFAGVLRAKTEMLEHLPENGTVFVNGDDPYLSKISCKPHICRFGLAESCEVTAEKVHIMGTDGMELTILAGERHIDAKISAYGIHMVSAALGAAAVGIQMGLTDEEIQKGLAAYVPVGSRAGIINTDEITIIDDCYNANPTSVAAAIDSLTMLDCRRVCILGDMLELGDTAAALHREVGERAAKRGTSLVLTCGALSKNTAEGAREKGCENALHFESKAELINALPELIKKGDAVLVKASHSMKFEEIVKVLEKL